jgi:imidazolonepropionase-like amidohydrolase
MRKAFAMLLKKHGLGDKRKQPSRKMVIRIPARRPFRRGFNAYLRSEAKKQTDVELRKAIRAGIRRLK